MTNRRDQGRPVKTAIWGCGAVSELYYAPALTKLGSQFSVVALFDPSEQRVACLNRTFPKAAAVKTFGELPRDTELVIIASPPAYHVEQSVEALKAGCHVLCEKPVATTTEELEKIVRAGRETSRLAIAGLFRRFFPSSVAVKHLLESGAFGQLESFDLQEGDRFMWESRSSALFQRRTACGGVLADIGSHVLDLLTWWLGPIELKRYSDDFMGGVESNCLLEVQSANHVPGTIRLSRDCQLSNRYRFKCENGIISWIVGEANGLELTLPDGQVLAGELVRSSSYLSAIALPEADYFQSFVNQLVNVAQSIRGEAEPIVSISSVTPGVRLLEQCYANRQLMRMGWLSEKEVARAGGLNQGEA